MRIEIRNDRSLSEIIREFHAAYSFLKIEFFSKGHRKGSTSSPAQMFADHGVTIGDIRDGGKEGVLEILPAHTVWEVENAFEKEFGLHVQVYRKSGRLWMETSATDGWTLAKQNAEGEEMSHPVEPDKRPDFREQE